MAIQKDQKKPRLHNMMAKQFTLALIEVAKRSQIGHEKYYEIDTDWQGFTRTPIEDYEDAQIRHLLGIGEPEETDLDHLTANAWNALAKLELYLRDRNESIINT